MQTTKRVALASILTQCVGLAVAVAQPTPEEEGGEPAEPVEASSVEAPAEPPEVEAEEVAAPVIDRGEPADKAGYDKGFVIKTGDGKYGLKFTGRLQPFYTLHRETGPVDYRQAFEIRRARVTFEGNLGGNNLHYKMQTDFGKGLVSLKDFHVDLRLGSGDVWLRAGQWKRPFSRQQINSSGRLEITDRAITDKAFGAGRDIGIAIRNDYEKSSNIEWIAGVFNGTGEAPKLTGTVEVDPTTGEGTITGGTLTNVPSRFKPAFIARVGLNDGGIKGYSEADLEGGGLRWGAAASVWIEGDLDKNDASNQKVELDYVVKSSGFSSTGGFYGMSEQTGAQTFSTQELAFVGFHLQAGYMVTPRIQGVARYALVDARLDDSKDQQEISIGGNYFGRGHDGKLVGRVRFLKEGDAGFADAILLEVGANVGW